MMAGHLAQMKNEWNAFKGDDAGERFQHQRERMEERSRGFQLVSLAFGIVLLVAGVVFCVLPGPGLPLIIFGLALIAARSMPLAKVLDRAEPRLRQSGRAILRRWRAIPSGAKVSVIAGIVLFGIASGTFVWHFVISAYLLD